MKTRKRNYSLTIPYCVILLLLFSHDFYGQVYIRRTIDLRDSINRKYFHSNVDLPGAILIDGYLNGKIKGYKSAFDFETTKRKPVTDEQKPSGWEAGREYYQGEIVWFGDAFFEARIDAPNKSKGPVVGKEWNEYVILGEPAGRRFYFPSLKDTLTQKEFLQRMTSYPGIRYERWQPGRQYYAGDRVEYQNYTYECLDDPRGDKIPSSEPQFWTRSFSDGPQFYVHADISVLSIVYHLAQQNKNTVAIPQMINVESLNQMTGLFMPVVSFDFNEAILYLRSVRQPQRYSSFAGFIGSSTLLLEMKGKPELLQLIKNKLKAKALKPNKKLISNYADYNQYLTDTINFADMMNWDIHQAPYTKNLVISKSVPGAQVNHNMPFMAIEIKTVMKFLGKPGTKGQGYAEVILAGQFNSSMDTLDIDTLAPKRATALPMVSLPNPVYSFYENYYSPIDSLSINKKLMEVWKVVDKSFYTRNLTFKQPLASFYPWSRRWKNITLGSWGWEDLFIGRNTELKVDSIGSPMRFDRLTVNYKKYINDPARTSEPYEITFDFINQMEVSYSYTLDWAKLKKELSGRSEAAVTEFIKRIENGTFNYEFSEVVYGLIEEK